MHTWETALCLAPKLTVNFINQRRHATVKGISMEGDILVMGLHKRVSSMTHENNVLLWNNWKTWVIKVRDSQNLCRWHVSAQTHRQRKHTFALALHLSNLNLVYVFCSAVRSEEIREQLLVHSPNYTHITERMPRPFPNACAKLRRLYIVTFNVASSGTIVVEMFAYLLCFIV